jgi:hypothetical protein
VKKQKDDCQNRCPMRPPNTKKSMTMITEGGIDTEGGRSGNRKLYRAW